MNEELRTESVAGVWEGHERGWYEMRLHKKLGTRSFKPYRPDKEFCIHPKTIGK